MPIPRTRIMELLDAQGVPYRVLPHSEPVFTIETAAQQRGVVRSEMVKSILLRDSVGHLVMACVIGDARLDPKAVRSYMPAEWKRLYFASAGEILAVTGSVQGAVAPLALPDGLPVIFDEAICRCQKVNISSGDPMAGLELDPHDLARVARARTGRIAAADVREEVGADKRDG